MEQKPISAAAHTAAALRSQLNQITAASQMLEMSTEGRGRSYLAVINQGICRMLRIVGRMELEERLSAETPALSLTCIDLSSWMEDMGQKLESILSTAGIAFTFSCPSGLSVYTDRSMLQQLLLELITHLALAATEINLTVTAAEQNIHFTINDSGPGVAQGRPVMPRILEAHEETSSLDYAHRLAKLLGGALVGSSGTDLQLSLGLSLPVGNPGNSLYLEEPNPNWNEGGFNPALVALSELLPAAAFLPENME